MKKTNDKYEALKDKIHEMVRDCEAEMDREELKGYITKTNQPKMDELNADDRIGVEEVLTIGAWLALSHLHASMQDKKATKKDIQNMMAGKVTIHEIAPDDMPEDLKETIQSIVDTLRKIKESNK